jgi:hypothetical protein
MRRAESTLYDSASEDKGLTSSQQVPYLRTPDTDIGGVGTADMMPSYINIHIMSAFGQVGHLLPNVDNHHGERKRSKIPE